jgi:hypothetical protein
VPLTVTCRFCGTWRFTAARDGEAIIALRQHVETRHPDKLGGPTREERKERRLAERAAEEERRKAQRKGWLATQ